MPAQLSSLGKHIEHEMRAQTRSVDKYYKIMQDMEETAHPEALDNALRNVQLQEAELDGMGKLAHRLGFQCNCETKAQTGRRSHCACVKRRTRKKRKP